MSQNSRTPAELQYALEALLAEIRAVEWSKAPAEVLAPVALSLKAACDHAALVHAEIETRVLANGIALPGVTTKPEVKHRQWSCADTAAQLAQEEFGDAAFNRTLKSPAQLEKLPKSAPFVSLASFKPETGKRVVY